MNRMKKFIELFEIPPAIQPYVDVFAESDEIDLILAMDGNTMNVDQVANLLNLTVEQAHSFLEKSYQRHFVHREVNKKKAGYIVDHTDTASKAIRYIPARFYDRLDELAMYGNWDQIPDEVRKEITDWWLKDYIDKISPVVENIKQDPDAYQQIKQKDFLLLEEALDQVRKATIYAVVNCDCRSSTQGCSRMIESCIRLDDGAKYTLERGLGRQITSQECKAIVLKADREGLMHIGTRHKKGQRLSGFCNCCTCCCFPLRASKALNSEKVYPKVHYVAVKTDDNCTNCGLCVKRCQYGAFYYDDSHVVINDKKRKKVVFDPAKCYGCGLCRTACPKECIEMLPFGSS